MNLLLQHCHIWFWIDLILGKREKSHIWYSFIITDLTTGEKWNVCIQDERLVMKFHCVTFSSFFLLAQNFSKKSVKSVLLYNFFFGIVYNTTDVNLMLRQIDKTSKSKVFATCICKGIIGNQY